MKYLNAQQVSVAWAAIASRSARSVAALVATAVLLLGITPPSNAATGFSGKVIFVGIYGGGSIFIQLDAGAGINEPGCVQNIRRIDIAGTHPQIKSILAIALAARASGQTLTGQVNGCFSAGSWPTIDNSFSSYIGLVD